MYIMIKSSFKTNITDHVIVTRTYSLPVRYKLLIYNRNEQTLLV